MKMALLLNVLLVLTTMGVGASMYFGHESIQKFANKNIIKGSLAAFAFVMFLGLGFMAPDIAYAAESTATGATNGLGLIGMALSTGLACIGAGYAVGAVGASALGAVSEDPKMLGKSLIFIGLGEGIAIYGLIISIIILSKL